MSAPEAHGHTDGPPQPSDSQWDAIRECDAHLLVAAGAGTGKTFTVVQKLLFLLGVPVRDREYAPRLELRDIAAITYTTRAAAELAGKLRSSLRAAGRRREAYGVDGARVGTIHSFCGDILREFALRSGRPPAMSLLDEAEGAMLRDECAHEALVAAIEGETIAELPAILAAWSMSEVEGWIRMLLGDGERLSLLAGRAGVLPPAEGAIVELARSAHARAVERLTAAGALDFERMIVWTRDLLRDDLAVRRTLQRRIRVLIVDEFQDVDPVQKEIAYLLGDPESGRRDTTRLVLVGDPKQSIYRFRRADVTVWRSVERDFLDRGLGAVVRLGESRRSVPAVLGFIDHTVGRVLDAPVAPGEPLADFEVPYASLDAVRATDIPAWSGVELLVTPPAEDGTPRRAGDVRAAEAQTVARRARELHDEHGVQWKDMAVLLCGWGAADAYAAALAAARIPVYALHTTGFHEQREVTDILIALAALRDPTDDRSLYGFLRSPFAGVRDETLLRIARDAGSPAWPGLVSRDIPDPLERSIVQRASALLERLGALRDRVSVAELIEELLRETGYLAHLELNGEDGKQRIANVRKLVHLAAGMREASVAEFLQTMARARTLAVNEGSARLHGEDDDVVTISSVHSAKGLEWRVVFWCDLLRTPPGESGKLLVGETGASLGAIVLGAPEAVAKEQGTEWQALRETIERERLAESKRLWYVAATRARDLLVLSGIPLGETKTAQRARAKSASEPEGAAGGPAELAGAIANPAAALRAVFGAALDGAGEIEYASATGVRWRARVRLTDPVSEDAGAPPVPELGDPALLAIPPDPIIVPMGRTRHSATQLIAHERCGRRHWLRYVMGVREPDRESSSGGARSTEAMDAVRRGLIVHEVLEHHGEGRAIDDLLESAIGRWDPDAPAPEERAGIRYRQALAAELSAVLARDEYRALHDDPRSRRELAFLHVLGPGSAIEGKIDIVGPVEPGAAAAVGYDVVDVKTSDCDPGVAVVKAEQYTLQRAAYVRALESISLGGTVERFGFEFTRAGVRVGDELPADLRAGDAARLDERLRLLHAGANELASSATECRFCGYRRAGWCPGVGGAPGEGAADAASAEREGEPA